MRRSDMLTSLSLGLVDGSAGSAVFGGTSDGFGLGWHDAAVSLDQAFGAEPCDLARLLHLQKRTTRLPGHRRLPWRRSRGPPPDAALACHTPRPCVSPDAGRCDPGGPTSQIGCWHHCTDDHDPPARVNREPDLIRRFPDDLDDD